MPDFSILFRIALGAILVNNLLTVRLLGICPMTAGYSIRNTIHLGAAAGLVMTLASAITWAIDHWILLPLHGELFSLLVYVITAATLVQMIETAFEKYLPQLYRTLGIHLPLLAANCAIVGTLCLNGGTNPYTHLPFTLIEAITNALCGSIGMIGVMILVASLQERIDQTRIPAPLGGMVNALVTAGLIALVFAGYAGLDRVGLH